MWQFGIFIFCLVVLYVLLAGAIGMYINAEKGRSKFFGFILGACLPLFGIIIVAINRPSSKFLIDEAENRDLISPKFFNAVSAFAESKDKQDFGAATKVSEFTQEVVLNIKSKLGKKK